MSNVTFARGIKAHMARFVKWSCKKCRDSIETGGYVNHMYCVKCNRWMEWEPIEYAGEYTC